MNKQPLTFHIIPNKMVKHNNTHTHAPLDRNEFLTGPIRIPSGYYIVRWSDLKLGHSGETSYIRIYTKFWQSVRAPDRK